MHINELFSDKDVFGTSTYMVFEDTGEITKLFDSGLDKSIQLFKVLWVVLVSLR
jgi:hypothetical protein